MLSLTVTRSRINELQKTLDARAPEIQEAARKYDRKLFNELFALQLSEFTELIELIEAGYHENVQTP